MHPDTIASKEQHLMLRADYGLVKVTLSDILSIVGFNLGIELMQLFIVMLIVPWVILLSRTALYSLVRIFGALFAAVAAIAWIAERSSGKPNMVSSFMQRIFELAPWGILILAIFAVVVFGWHWKTKKLST